MKAKSHVLSGLLDKRREIAGQIEHAHKTLNGLIADLDYIDNAIRIIDPDCDVSLTRPKRIPPRMGAFKGECHGLSWVISGPLRSLLRP